MVSDAYILGLVANATPCFGFFKGGGECVGCMLTAQCKALLEERTTRMLLTLQTKRALDSKKAATAPKKAKSPTIPEPVASSPDESIDDILATIDVSSPMTPPAMMASADFDAILSTTSSQDSDLSDFFNALSSVPGPVAPVAPLQTTASTFTMVTVVSDTPCCKCGKDISKNTQAAFFPGSGLAHSNCVAPGEV
jgi:hypothetical protein